MNCRLVLEFVTVFEKIICFTNFFRNYEIFRNRKMLLTKMGLHQYLQFIAQKRAKKMLSENKKIEHGQISL